jgi:hypothetical protein
LATLFLSLHRVHWLEREVMLAELEGAGYRHTIESSG